jgi:hypothetical protein
VIYSFFRYLEVPALFFTSIYDTILLSSFGISIFTSIFLSSPIRFYPHFLEQFEKNVVADPITFPAEGVFTIARFAAFLPYSSVLPTATQNLRMIRLHDHGKRSFPV